MIEEFLKQDRDQSRAKINSETAKIPWLELQRIFAAGNTLYVCSDLDLVDVACAFHEDNVKQVEKWTRNSNLTPVTDDQARTWYQEESSVWAIVVKPWVLVQTIK
jgi:hypothetical protein